MNGYPRNKYFLWIHEKADHVTKKLGNEDYTTMHICRHGVDRAIMM